MGVFDAVGSAEAKGELAAARAFGEKAALSHRGAADVTLYIWVEHLSLGSAVPNKGRQVETGRLVCLIPNQSGFVAHMTTTTRPITKGDRITYLLGGTRYFFVQEESDIEQLGNGYIYRVTAIEHKTKDIGIIA